MADLTLTLKIDDMAAQRVGLTNTTTPGTGSVLIQQVAAALMTLMDNIIVQSATNPSGGADLQRRATAAIDEIDLAAMFGVAAQTALEQAPPPTPPAHDALSLQAQPPPP